MQKEKKVVFIEDDDTYLEAYHYLLEKLRQLQSFQFAAPTVLYDKESASEVIDGWLKEPKTAPDLVFLDLILPKTFAFYREIQEERTRLKKSISPTENRMDTMAGITLYDVIRGNDSNSQTRIERPEQLTRLPIIILTANYRLAPSTRANRLDDKYLLWIDKPFIPEDVAGIVEKFLNNCWDKTK